MPSKDLCRSQRRHFVVGRASKSQRRMASGRVGEPVGIPKGIDGVVITDVVINTMGAGLGITPGDVVMRINASNIDSIATFLRRGSP